MVSTATNTAFPKLDTPVVTAEGHLTIPWYRFFVAMWIRTGSALGNIVSSVAVVPANGFAGTVANPTTTPAITLSTTVTGILYGNGAAISGLPLSGTGNVVLSNSPTINTPTIAGVNGAQAQLTASLTDTSAIAGNAAKFWNPLYFGNAGTAIVHRLNRVLVGEAALNSSDIGPVTTKDWMESLLSGTISNAQFASVSTIGGLAAMSASRSSDFRTIFGSAAGGAQGVTGIGYNDDTTAATTPIAAGVVGIGIRKAGVVGITLNQMDMNNGGSVVDTTPFGGVNSGSTWALGLTAGAYSTLGLANVTGAMYIGAGATAKFRKGIIVMNGALDTTLGSGGGGIAFEAYEGQSIRWLNSTNAVDAEVWGSPLGLTTNSNVAITQNGTQQAVAAGTLLHLTAADAVNNFAIFDTFLANNVVQFRTADGTSAVPAAVGSGRTIGVLNAIGYANGAYQTSRARLLFVTAEAWTATAQGANVVISAAPIGTTTQTDIATFSGQGLTANQGFSRGAPVTQTASFTLASNQNWIICNGTATITVTLPAASLFPGREVLFKNIAAFTVVSASANVIPKAGGAASTAILPATAGSSVTLVSDGTNWNIMQ